MTGVPPEAFPQTPAAAPSPAVSLPTSPSATSAKGLPDDAIWVITHAGPSGPELPEESARTRKGWPTSAVRSLDPRPSAVPTDKLEQEMGKFLGSMGRLFDQAERPEQVRRGLRLEEIELAIEIGAEGEVRLVGVAGAKASGKGAIKLTFRRVAA